MRILIDATEITPKRYFASIPRYVMRYIDAIPKEERHKYTLLIRKEAKEIIQKRYGDFKLLVCKLEGDSIIAKIYPFSLYYKHKAVKATDNGDYDIFFSPTDQPFFHYKYKGRWKKVIVIHDLKAIKNSYYAGNKQNRASTMDKLYSKNLETSDAIIAISKFTRQEIMEYYPQIDEKRIHIIYNSVILPEEAKCPKNFTEQKYILYVNTLIRYKNIMTLLKAFVLIKDSIPNNLVLVGKETDYWKETIVPFIHNNNIENRIIRVEGISDEELRYMYENAGLFVTPSLHEGFGYTPIEAAMCNCPVVSSIQEALLDSTQGKLNYYHPAMDEVALANKMQEVLMTPPTKEELKEIATFYKETYHPSVQERQIREILETV